MSVKCVKDWSRALAVADCGDRTRSERRRARPACLHAGTATSATDKKYLALSKVVGPDPMPYGMEANLKTILALEDTAFKQKLTPRRMSIDELFVNPEK